MEKRELYERKETWNMALICLTIPLSVIALAFAKKTKPKPCPCSDNKKTGNMNKPKCPDQIEAGNRAVDCFGTVRLLEKKRSRIRFWSKANKFIGLTIPVSLGLFYVSSKDTSLIPILTTITPAILPIATFLNAVLLLVSLLSLVYDWDIKIENYTKSISNNMRYYSIFCEIRERYYEDETKYANLHRETKLLDDTQQDNDGREDFSIKDRQFIAREGLHQFNADCPECHKKPILVKSKKCRNCGT